MFPIGIRVFLQSMFWTRVKKLSDDDSSGRGLAFWRQNCSLDEGCGLIIGLQVGGRSGRSMKSVGDLALSTLELPTSPAAYECHNPIRLAIFLR